MTAQQLYTTIFSSRIKCVVSEEKDALLSIASLDKLQAFLPKIDVNVNRDLLPISFNACVVNRANKNKDLINTAIALQIYDTFKYKYINIEHDRHKAVGVILTAGFSEFGTDKPLDPDDIKEYTEPFNITLGGVVWRTVNKNIAEFIEECSDPESDNYLKISASWELGYTDYSLALIPEGSKNLEDGRLITEATEIEALKNNLIVFGGSGKVKDDYIYRVPSEGVLAIGIGLTENPAADVKGVAIELEEEQESEVHTDTGSIINSDKKDSNNISQDKTEDVKENRTYMKITSIKDITDESLKTVQASAISEFIESEISKINTLYITEKESKQAVETKFKEDLARANQDLESTKTELNTVKSELAKINEAVAAKQAEDIFTARMASFEEEYELDDEDRGVLASQIKGLSDEAFAAFQKNAKVLLKKHKKQPKEAKASVETKVEVKTEDNKAAVEEAVDKSKVQGTSVPVTPSAEQSLRERWANAFKPENILVKVR